MVVFVAPPYPGVSTVYARYGVGVGKDANVYQMIYPSPSLLSVTVAGGRIAAPWSGAGPRGIGPPLLFRLGLKTDRGQSVPSGAVYAEACAVMPQATTAAPLQPCLKVFFVHLNRHACPAGGNLHCPISATHVAPLQ